MYDLIEELERIHGKPLSPEEGAILIDYSVYFPFPNKQMVVMDMVLLEDFNVDAKELFHSESVIQNHRFPNKNHITLTKVNGSKHCKFGTFLVDTRENLNKMKYIAFQVYLDGIAAYVGIFPIQFELTEEKPFVSLTCFGGAIVSRSDFKDFRLVALEPKEEGVWIMHYSLTSKEDYETTDETLKPNCTLLQERVSFHVTLSERHYVFYVYETPIMLYATNKSLLGIH